MFRPGISHSGQLTGNTGKYLPWEIAQKMQNGKYWEIAQKYPKNSRKKYFFCKFFLEITGIKIKIYRFQYFKVQNTLCSQKFVKIWQFLRSFPLHLRFSYHATRKNGSSFIKLLSILVKQSKIKAMYFVFGKYICIL